MPPLPMNASEQEVYNDALSAIEECKKSGATQLVLGGMRLHSLPPEIGMLTSLRRLFLHDNNLTRLPPEIGKLKVLNELWLSNNKLRRLPLELDALTKLKSLFLHGNEALGLPIEVLGPNIGEVEGYRAAKPASPRAILDYYFEKLQGATQPLNEVRLVLVGPPESGKTSLVERLVYDNFTAGHSETLGVELCDWKMPKCKGGEVLAHVWDFAGQTITHAMHQFFLSPRTVYLLVITGRGNREREDVEYWLRLISAFGMEKEGDAGPPVIVALNKWDDPGSAHARIDRNVLIERYPFIIAFVETDCKTQTGILALRSLLDNTVGKLEWVRSPFPVSYQKVKTRLSSVKDPHLPYNEYRRICRECGITNVNKQDNLAKNLHALGVALNYRDDERLRFASILKPAWLTEHVYSLVRHAERSDGMLRRFDLPQVLENEADDKIRHFLANMMVRFEIAYPLSEDSEEPTAWLVPQSLPDSQPAMVSEISLATESTRLRYRYAALPESLVPRFIVRTHPFIEGDLRWKSGVVLAKDGARALVRANYIDKIIEIIAVGPDASRRELAGLARREFQTIHGDIRGLDPEEETEVEVKIKKAIKKSWMPISALEADEAMGRSLSSTAVKGLGTGTVDPTRELNEFSAEAARDDSWKPKVFVSYSHTDEAQRKKLELYLEVLVTHGLLHEKWDDRKIQAGDDWDQVIRAELEEADVVLILVSTAALASRYIQAVEMKRALERHSVGKSLVVPILIEDCAWKLPELKKLQVLPAGARPIKEWAPQSKGWKSVSDGLMSLFDKLRAGGPKSAK